MSDRQIMVAVLTIGVATLWLTVEAANGLTQTDIVTAGSFVAGAALMWMALKGRK